MRVLSSLRALLGAITGRYLVGTTAAHFPATMRLTSVLSLVVDRDAVAVVPARRRTLVSRQSVRTVIGLPS